MKKHFFRLIGSFLIKYQFILCFLVSFFGIISLDHSSLAVTPPPVAEIRGVWITTNDTHTVIDQPKLKESIAQLAQLNFNTLYPVVWNSGYALYESELAKKAGIQPFSPKGLQGQDTLKDLITEAHQQGLRVMPWFEFGFMAPPSSELALNHPNWLSKKRDGSQTTLSAAGEVVWLNPFLPEVQKFITDLVVEVATKYDIDGIQFDDHLCFPYEMGYDAYTLNLYKQETEQDAPTDPKDPQWMRWRADKLTAFVSQLNQTLKAHKPKAVFSISPNPYYVAYNFFLQDWLAWARQDLIDEVIVQIYRPELSSFVKELAKPEIAEVREKIPVGVGILTGLRNRPIPIPLIEEKVLAARQYGLGIAFFFYDSLWNNAPESSSERQSRFLALFPSPVDAPLRKIPVTPIEETVQVPTATQPPLDSQPPPDSQPVSPYKSIPIPVETAW